MNKKILIALVAASALFGCGGEVSSSTAPNEPSIADSIFSVETDTAVTNYYDGPYEVTTITIDKGYVTCRMFFEDENYRGQACKDSNAVEHGIQEFLVDHEWETCLWSHGEIQECIYMDTLTGEVR